jgi:hypothetical protein
MQMKKSFILRQTNGLSLHNIECLTFKILYNSNYKLFLKFVFIGMVCYVGSAEFQNILALLLLPYTRCVFVQFKQIN